MRPQRGTRAQRILRGRWCPFNVRTRMLRPVVQFDGIHKTYLFFAFLSRGYLWPDEPHGEIRFETEADDTFTVATRFHFLRRTMEKCTHYDILLD